MAPAPYTRFYNYWPMKNQIIISAIAAYVSLGAYADILTPEQALSRLSSDGSLHKRAVQRVEAKAELAHTVNAAGRPGVYVFNDKQEENGFIIVSADDCAPALLGYSDTGEPFDINRAPSNLVKWLEGYANQIAWSSQYAESKFNSSTLRGSTPKVDVAPKIETLWDQGTPYNDWCPLLSGSKTYTGCVATAMAQIVNWHKLPTKPKGSYQYKSWYTGYHSINFDTVSFQWDKMLNTYDAQSPVENRAAVASLMQACGYICDMEYASWGSGAASMRAAFGLSEFLGFDKGVSMQQRDWYNNQDWYDMVYDELTTNGPVYYDGTGEGGGHAFVCDGYNASDGFYHFNWGWSGVSNGYYRLDALVPDLQGAGGVSVGYSWDQGIMRGLRKAQEGSKPVYQIKATCGVRSPWEKQQLGKNVSITGYETNDGFWNVSNDSIPLVSLGVEIMNTASKEKRYVYASNYANDPTIAQPKTWAYAQKQLVIVYFLPKDLTDGDYQVRPVFKSGDSEWMKLKGNASVKQYVNMKVANDSAYFSLGQSDARLRIEILNAPEYFTTSDEYTLKCKMTNVGTADYTGEICSVFLGENESGLYVAAQGMHRYTSLNAGQSEEFEYTSTNPTGKIVDGEYLLCFGDCNGGEIISDPYPAKVGNRFGSLKFHYYDLNVENRSMIDAEKVHVSWTMECPQGTYNGPLALIFSKTKKPFNPDYAVLSEPMTITAVETRAVDFTGKLYGPMVGDILWCCPGYVGENGEYVAIGTNPISAVIANEAVQSAVQEVCGNEILSITITDLSGRVVSSDLESLGSGVYLVTYRYADGSNKTLKFIR